MCSKGGMWTPEHRERQKALAAKRKRYPSDLTDEEWLLLQPLMPAPGRTGRPRESDLREMINALRYLVRSGCGWRMLPIHFGAWETVYWWFRRLARRLLFATLHEVVLMLDRECQGVLTQQNLHRSGRNANASAGVVICSVPSALRARLTTGLTHTA